jgi:transposase
VFVALDACDMRKGFEGLAGTGLWLMTKRLEKGTFSWPRDTEGKGKLALRPEALAMLTDGVDLRGAKLRPWYEWEA